MPVGNCPQCGSTNTKSFSIVHGTGTSTSRSSSFSISSKGRSRGGVGQSTRQSQLAAATAPPRRPSILFSLLVGVILYVALFNLSGVIIRLLPAAIRPYQELFTLAALALSLFLALLFHAARKHRYRPKLELWGRSWVCLRCGSTWAY